MRAELSWVPGDVLQAEDRAHRIGQESSVTVEFLLVRVGPDPRVTGLDAGPVGHACNDRPKG